MANVIKKYWDIFGGVATGLILTILAEFELTKVQLYYSIIILILVSIGVFKIIKQTIDKKKEKKRQHNLIDAMVDSQKSIKAIRLAQNPTKDGEEIGKLLIKIWEGIKIIMSKLKTFFDKFKGYILTIALGVLTVIEMCGGYINDMFGEALTINGVEILPVVTLGATVIVGLLSNGYSKDQKEKIKALFSKSSTNELVKAEIKKTVKDKEAKLKEFNKILLTKENELSNLTSELETVKNTYSAKVEMFNMVPQLATNEDIRLAHENVNAVSLKIDTKKVEIEETKTTINKLKTEIGALKTQL